MSSPLDSIKSALREPYTMQDGRVVALSGEQKVEVTEEMESGINVVKTYLKRWSGFYEFLRAFFSPGLSMVPHLTPGKAVTKAFGRENILGKHLVNIGSGTKFIHKDMVNVDIYPYENVHIVADGAHLPFHNESIDFIVCESVLEHVREPFKVIEEIKRVLRPGGYAYISVPFLYPFHASPNDFTRFSRNALRNEFAPYKIVDEGLRAGPFAALQGVLMHLCALPFSILGEGVYLTMANIFMVIFTPLKFLDILFWKSSFAHEIAADIYIFVRKE